MAFLDTIYQFIDSVYTNFGFVTNGLIVTYAILFLALRNYSISADGIRVLSQNYIVILTAFLAAMLVTLSFNEPVTRQIMQDYSLLLNVMMLCCLLGIFSSLCCIFFSYTSGFNNNAQMISFNIATFVIMIPLWSISLLIGVYLKSIKIS